MASANAERTGLSGCSSRKEEKGEEAGAGRKAKAETPE